MRAPNLRRAAWVAATTLVLLPGTAAAKGKYYNAWKATYPSSATDDNVINGTGASCQVCHRDSTGGEPWNPYGWRLRELLSSGLTIDEALAAAEPLDSDGNGDTNLVEIQSDTQPAWTPGPNNTIFFADGTQQPGQLPPALILGDLDPPGCGTVTTYCTAGTSASGCRAALSASGVPSATASTGFVVSAGGVEGNKDALLFFGTSGRQANPWGNGTSFQCVVPPVKRGGLLDGAGTPGACDGTFAQDLNALWCAACPRPNHNPGAGALVQAQLWYRDPANTSNQTTSLSDALEFTVCP
jgi:hypothetical protein